ncbi:MAG: aminomethyl-transferring glycine dehydrogenase subunit GcvPA [Nitrospinaceae bacterium]
MRYIPHTEKDIQEMLASIGVNRIEDLFACIPEKLRLGDTFLNLPESLSETELTAVLHRIQKRNPDPDEVSLFLGAGAYHHFSPVLVDHLTSRGEFSTSYTPYQPEVSQGTLQAIFEFQTMICMLTGMEAANASMYDGASALAESILMAHRINKKTEILMARAVHPEYRRVAATYTRGNEIRLIEVPFNADGKTDIDFIRNRVNGETSAVVLQTPNFFGAVEEYAGLGEQLAGRGILLIVVVAEALSLGILTPPGARGADIVVGEGQSLGLPLSFGGPYVGFFAVRDQFLRQTPGRLVGQTVDREGRRAYVLTLSTREQHIRRERATSNICTNQGLCALAAAVYLATLGKQGIREIAILNVRKADALKNRLGKISGFQVRFAADTFNEFVLECPRPAREVREILLQEKIIAGLPLGSYYPDLENCLLLCATEMNTQEEMDRLAGKLEEI